MPTEPDPKPTELKVGLSNDFRGLWIRLIILWRSRPIPLTKIVQRDNNRKYGKHVLDKSTIKQKHTAILKTNYGSTIKSVEYRTMVNRKFNIPTCICFRGCQHLQIEFCVLQRNHTIVISFHLGEHQSTA